METPPRPLTCAPRGRRRGPRGCCAAEKNGKRGSLSGARLSGRCGGAAVRRCGGAWPPINPFPPVASRGNPADTRGRPTSLIIEVHCSGTSPEFPRAGKSEAQPPACAGGAPTRPRPRARAVRPARGNPWGRSGRLHAPEAARTGPVNALRRFWTVSRGGAGFNGHNGHFFRPTGPGPSWYIPWGLRERVQRTQGRF